MPIAVVPFKWTGGVKLADADVSAIVASDLARSGKFSPLPEKDLLSNPQTPEDVHFKTWRMVGVDHLVIGGVQLQEDGSYQVQFRLFDVLKVTTGAGLQFSC